MQRHPDDRTGRALTPRLVISAYVQGYFPMGDGETDQIHWFSPDERAILSLSDFRPSRSWRRAVRRREFELRCDSAFAEVVNHCARPRSEDDGVWITDEIKRTYIELHDMGVAHSVEIWLHGNLVGGVYGLAIRSAFFAESMFSIPDLGGAGASKVALWFLVRHLIRRGFTLFDAQYLNEHTEMLGFVEITRNEYLARLGQALKVEDVTWGQVQTY